MTGSTHEIRLRLSEEEARALHAGLLECTVAELLSPRHAEVARQVLARLEAKVPKWLERAPVGGEAGYLLAAEAVLRALIAAEERGRSRLSDVELTHALAAAKPVGVSVADVLTRMRREQLVRRHGHDGGGTSWTAAPAGRRLLAGRDGLAAAVEWQVSDAHGLAELIFRERRAGSEAHRPSVQAIGQLGDERFEPLARDLREAGLLQPSGDEPDSLTLSRNGRELAEKRIRPSLSPGTVMWQLPAPPLPYRRGLPLHVERRDRYCTCGTGHAAWLERSSKTKLRRTLLRDGAVEWSCRWCARRWLVYLQAHAADGRPAYDDPAAGIYNRVVWRPW